MQELIEYLVKSIVSNPDDVEISQSQRASDFGKDVDVYTIKVNSEDMGLIIGKGGQTIQSVRNIAKVKAIKQGKYIDVMVFDPNADDRSSKDDGASEDSPKTATDKNNVEEPDAKFADPSEDSE